MTTPVSDHPGQLDGEGLNLAELGRKLRRGWMTVLGLTLVGVVAGTLLSLMMIHLMPQETIMRVGFSFPGFEKGQNPDGSKFLADDLRAPDVVAAALQRAGGRLTGKDISEVRGAISITGLIPPGIIKERDRLRAAGQTVAPYVPDEYVVSLSLSGINLVGGRDRELFLSSLYSAYTEKFRRTYELLPPQFGNAFEALRGADFSEYEFVLNQEMQDLRAFLIAKLEKSRGFRSSATHLSFADLISRVEFFTQINLNEVLGLIQSHGLTNDRQLALMKMDYHGRILSEEEKRAQDELAVVRELMDKSESHPQNFVLGVKSQLAAPRSEAPLIDQGLIDTLVQNDSYNFLVHKALDAGIQLSSITARKNELTERRKRLETFTSSDEKKQADAKSSVTRALEDLQRDYKQLMDILRQTLEDFERQRLADAVALTMQPTTAGIVSNVIFAALLGGILGAALGIGLSMLGPLSKPASSP